MNDKKDGKISESASIGLMGLKARDTQNWLRQVQLGKAERASERAKITLPKVSFLDKECPSERKK